MNIQLIKKDQRGVSLIELLIGIFIMSIGFFSVIKMQTYAVKGTLWAQKRTNAIYLCQQYIESSLTTPFDSLDNLNDQTNTIKLNKSNYQIITKISPLGQLTPTKTVRVEVAWELKSIHFEVERQNIF